VNLKREGVSKVIALGNKEMMGKTLLKLLSKMDRPFAAPLAFKVATAILPSPSIKQPSPENSPAPGSKAWRNHIKAALTASGASLTRPNEVTELTPLEYATALGHTKAATLLKQLEMGS